MKKGIREMFYIVVNDNDTVKVVTSANGPPREFSKRKKAQNFINGRAYLEVKSPQIVTEINGIEQCFKVDL